MCVRKCILRIGEKIFHVLVFLGLIGGLASAINSGMTIGGKDGLIAGGIQLIISWSGTLIIALVVYSLLDISQNICVAKECHDKDSEKCHTDHDNKKGCC